MGLGDTIADAFLNSSRKTLRFIPPSTQKDEIIIKPTPAMIQNLGIYGGSHRGGALALPGQPVVLQPWEQEMSLRRQKHLQVPVWIRIRHLPMEYWTEDGLSAVASGIGTPLYTDKITKNCLRLDFAREIPIKVDIDYEWLPLRCVHCCSLGHTAATCPETRVTKQRAPVTVYVQKRQSMVGERPGEQGAEVAPILDQVALTGDTCPSRQDDEVGGDVAKLPTTHNQNIPPPAEETMASAISLQTKGKEIIVYNPFAVLGSEETDLVPSNVLRNAGPKLSSPAGVPP
ncbi:UNVERIFIED_CONTAM: hypothetical protein Sradi_7063600 [Sesamum radiatum]|uniref:DUF4283 domain-containing protein n=1 Tax=Sesamum radiatum TaxID=300843 RepID=A0AAW2J780_SESRA